MPTRHPEGQCPRQRRVVAGASFEDIVALSAAKDVLREAVLLPLQMPKLLTGVLEPPKGVLLFGPPGTGRCRCTEGHLYFPWLSYSACGKRLGSQKLRQNVLE